MIGTIAVLDLASGTVTDRPRETPTLDVPKDLPRPTGVVSVDDGARGRYVDADGNELMYGALLRPLSWRARGEECLVAEPKPRRGSSPRRYRISLIKRTHD
jgi:hypothetical protein